MTTVCSRKQRVGLTPMKSSLAAISNCYSGWIITMMMMIVVLFGCNENLLVTCFVPRHSYHRQGNSYVSDVTSSTQPRLNHRATRLLPLNYWQPITHHTLSISKTSISMKNEQQSTKFATFLRSSKTDDKVPGNDDNTNYYSALLHKIATFVSQTKNSRKSYPEYNEMKTDQDRKKTQILTLLRVGIPSLFASVVATLIFPGLSMLLATYMTEPGVFTVLSQDSSQFVQNFLSVASLLFSILVGQTCKSMEFLVGLFLIYVRSKRLPRRILFSIH